MRSTETSEIHVRDAVAADVVDHHVEDVRAFVRLLFRERGHAVEVAREQQVAEGARTGRVHALTDHEERRVLFERTDVYSDATFASYGRFSCGWERRGVGRS